MSVYIYLFQDRVIYWTPQTMYSKPANVSKITWYSVSGAIPMPLNDMVAKGNVGYNMQKGFYTIEGDYPLNWDDREQCVKQIQIMGSFNSIANTQKARYTDNTMGQALIDILTLDEIRLFRQTNSLEECPILTSMHETIESDLTPEAMVTKLWLRYESFRTIVGYLNRLEYSIRKLCENNEFEQATDLVNSELEKMRM